jgi:predicted transposase/invertase (TIGR01784 family)
MSRVQAIKSLEESMAKANKKAEPSTEMVEKRYIMDPKSDIVFKKIFGEHPNLVKSFLNSILPLPPGRKIETIDYLPSEQTPRIPSMKNTIVDVKCTDQDGRIFITEMQMVWHSSFDKRLLHGASRAFSQQLKVGEIYPELCPVYGLAIVNEVFEKNVEDWYHHYRLIHGAYPDKVLEGLELIFVELPKFKPQTLQDQKLAVLWLRFLKEINITSQSVPKEFLEDPEIALAVELAQESSYTEAELAAYDAYLDAVRVEKTARYVALKEGEEKGMAKGMAKGIEEGMAKGSHDRATLVAKNLIKLGLKVDDIAETTQLDVEMIRKLVDEISKPE